MADIEIEKEQTVSKLGFRKSFIRSITNSLIATFIDYVVTIVLATYFQVYYLSATLIGNIFGAVTSFLIGRHWVYKKRNARWQKQVIRFIIINMLSIYLNTTGVYFLIENFGMSLMWAKTSIAIAVGIFFNFIMQKYFVFK
jgi:putative flippase GtrA